LERDTLFVVVSLLEISVSLFCEGCLPEFERVYVSEWTNGSKIDTLRHNGPEHVLCYAPPRSGKGVGLVVPTMLTWPPIGSDMRSFPAAYTAVLEIGERKRDR
jgi:hypothetical protein